jgi:hypothetical protein
MHTITEMQRDAEKRQQEVVDMIEALADTTSSDIASSVWKFITSLRSGNDFTQMSGVSSGFHNR